MRSSFRSCLAAAVLVAGLGCATSSVPYPSGMPVVYEDPGSVGRFTSTEIQSEDIVAITDAMLRDMLAEPVLAGRANAPRVIIDDKYFANSSSQRFNKRLITNRLRVELNRAARGRMVFVARNQTRMVEEERGYKRAGLVDEGSLPLTRAPLGGDYRLGGEFADLAEAGPIAGQVAKYTQVTFEMVDLETGELVWSGIYEIEKSAMDHVVYR